MDSTDSQRNKPRGSGKINDEVQKLFRRTKGKITKTDIENLRKRYSDVQLANSVQDEFVRRYSEVHRRAKKFAQLVREKYGDRNYPFHVLLQKALKYKAKYKLSEDEFAAFKRLYEQDLYSSKDDSVYLVQTQMQKVLGTRPDGSEFNVSDSDYKYLQEILKLAASSRTLHAQVILQSLQMGSDKFKDDVDEDESRLSGLYDPSKGHMIGEHVHPVVVAMFGLKINALDRHFLYSNLSNMVKCLYNKERLQTRPDQELFYSLIRDPNDVVCSAKSPVLDLHNRALLQQHLWLNVLNLRNGLYFHPSSVELLTTLDMCKLSKFDGRDIIYGRNDGALAKRFFSALSFNPTIVASLPAAQGFHNQIYVNNPYKQNVKPKVTSIPMVNLRLPLGLNNAAEEPLQLSQIEQIGEYFSDTNGSLELHQTSLVYSRDVIMFYIDRRTNAIDISKHMSKISYVDLPRSVSGFDKINNREVDFDINFTIRGSNEYLLRSIVCAKTNDVMGTGDAIIGSTTLLRTKKGVLLEYDPYAVTLSKKESFTTKPTATSFLDKGKAKGVIFIYEMVSEGVDKINL